MKRYFITSSGTDAGKTLITAALARQFGDSGRRVRVLKPVATGVDKRVWPPADGDASLLMQGMGVSPSREAFEAMTLFQLEAPLSPAMAAARERRSIPLQDLVDFCSAAERQQPDILLVEGAGGVMTPLNDGATMLDWMKALGYPAVLVLNSYLGAISHGLTAYHALRAAGLEIALVVVNASPDSPVQLTETAESFARFIQAPMVAVPRLQLAGHSGEQVPDLLHTLDNDAPLKRGAG